MKLLHSRITLAMLFLLCLSFPARPWGCKGHQTVALIAEQNLTPEALQLVNKLLSENPVDPALKRYCADPAHDLLADASTWPDDVRNIAKNGPWHYIDIPRGAARAPLSQFCGPGSCITQAIADQGAILPHPVPALPQRRSWRELRPVLFFLAHSATRTRLLRSQSALRLGRGHSRARYG